MLTLSSTADPVLAAPVVANDDKQIYQIPAAYRRMENLHILLWLLKDIG